MAQYDYSISNDTATGAVNSEQLWIELHSLIAANPGFPALENIMTEGDDLSIFFASALSGAEQGQLTAAVAAHVPAPPVAPSPSVGNQLSNSDPTVDDDSTLGYEPSVRWLNVATGEEYLCTDATAAAAVWKSTTSGGGALAVYVDYYDSGSTAVGVTPTVLGLNTERQSNALFSLATNEVTVQAGGAGDYLVTYGVTFGETDTSIRVAETWLEINGTEVPATRGEVSHWFAGGTAGVDGTCGRTAILSLSVGDVVRVMAQVTYNVAGYDTATGGVGLTIASIGANGPAGPQGPPGAGSTINVEDNGSAIANTPHSSLNFVGFNVADGGSGVADIGPMFGADYQGVGSRPRSTTTSTTFQIKATLATPVLTGTYRIKWQAVIDQENGADSVEVRLRNRTLALDVGSIQRLEPKDTDNREFAGGSGGIVFSNQSMTFDIEWRQQEGGTAGIQDAIIELWRVS